MNHNVFVFALLVTLLIETLAAAILLVKFSRPSSLAIDTVLAVVAVNLISHPLAWIAFLQHPTNTSFCIIELLVIAVETILLWQLTQISLKESIYFCLAANLISAGLGAIGFAFFGR